MPGGGPAPGASGDSRARSYAAYVQEEDARLGKGKGLLEPEGEDDPFADPFGDGEAVSGYEVMTPGIQEKRMEWKEV